MLAIVSKPYTVDEALDYVKQYPHLAEQITEEQIKCARFLEAKGYRFALDFNFSTAPEHIWSLIQHVEGKPILQ